MAGGVALAVALAGGYGYYQGRTAGAEAHAAEVAEITRQYQQCRGIAEEQHRAIEELRKRGQQAAESAARARERARKEAEIIRAVERRVAAVRPPADDSCEAETNATMDLLRAARR
jgi:uncharacterized protein HemX